MRIRKTVYELFWMFSFLHDPQPQNRIEHTNTKVRIFTAQSKLRSVKAENV